MTPALLLLLTTLQADPPPVYHTVKRGDIRSEVSERGEIKPARQSDLVAKVGNTTITWLIEDGSIVKKGEIVAKLDDTKAKEMVQQAEQMAAQKRADLVQFTEARAMALEKAKVELELAMLEEEIAKLEVAQETGKPGQRRAELKLKQVQRMLQLHQLNANAQQKTFDAAIVPMQLAVKAADEQLHLARLGLESCVLHAPHDGLATYYVPESSRFNTTMSDVGATVKEGQKLLSLSDLSAMAVVLKIHESQVNKLKPGMRALIKGGWGTTTGTVHSVATMASANDWASSDVKVYAVKVAMEKGEEGLKPGMSALVTILLGEQQNVLLVPVQAVHESLGRRYCMVKGKGRQMVRTGAVSTTMIEIIDGLKEGDSVQLNAPRLRRSEPEKEKVPAVTQPRELLVRSVRMGELSVRRGFVEEFGLREKDVQYLQTQLSGVEQVLPVQTTDRECRRLFTQQVTSAKLVATTPAWLDYHAMGQALVGRSFTEVDEAAMVPVVVLGYGVAERLFPQADPLGEQIRLNGRPWEVVGVLEQLGNETGWNESVITSAPLAKAYLGDTALQFKRGSRSAERVEYHHVWLRFTSEAACTKAALAIESYLEATHPVKDWEVVRFER